MDACAIPREMVLTTISRVPLAPMLGHCALVGTGSSLLGSNLGTTIDAFTTVVRVNRLPSSEYVADVGQRTTILFKNQLAELVGSRVMVRFLGEEHHNPQQDTYPYPLWCDLRQKPVRACATFDALVYEGALDAAARWPSHGPLRSARVYAARQSDALHLFQTQVVGLGLARPAFSGREALYRVRATGGAKAFFTFALLCDSLTLFGFSGNGTIDRHFGRERTFRDVRGDASMPRYVNGHDYMSEHTFFSARGKRRTPACRSAAICTMGAQRFSHLQQTRRDRRLSVLGERSRAQYALPTNCA